MAERHGAVGPRRSVTTFHLRLAAIALGALVLRIVYVIVVRDLAVRARTALRGQVNGGDGRGLFTMVVLGAAAVLAGVTRLLDRFIDVVAERLRYERDDAPLLVRR